MHGAPPLLQELAATVTSCRPHLCLIHPGHMSAYWLLSPTTSLVQIEQAVNPQQYRWLGLRLPPSNQHSWGPQSHVQWRLPVAPRIAHLGVA